MLSMLHDGYQGIPQTHSFPKSEGKQLLLGFDLLEDSPREFISEAMMTGICNKHGIHIDAEMLENFRVHLNAAVCHQQRQPIKYIKTARSEIFIYWDTWGVIRSADGHIRAGVHIWDEDTDATGKLITGGDTWYFLGILGKHFVLPGIYSAWLGDLLKSWQAEMTDPVCAQFPNTLMLISDLAAKLSRFGDLAENALAAIIKAMFPDLPHSHQIAWLAQDITGYDEFCPQDVHREYEYLYDDSAIRAAVAIPFSCTFRERNLLLLFGKIYKMLSRNREIFGQFNSGKELLSVLGVTQNGRECLYRLTSEEVRMLVRRFPVNRNLLRPFFLEVQTTLLKMDQIRRSNSVAKRPYLTTDLVNTIAVIAVLRHMADAKATKIANLNLREMFLHLRIADFKWDTLIALTKDNPEDRPLKYSLIKDTLKLLELYRDALLTPAEIRYESAIDEYTQQMIDSDDLAWMDDGGAELRKIALERPIRLVERKPNLDWVTDWFLGSSAVIDKQRAKRGWEYLETLAVRWHEQGHSDYSWVLDYPGWECHIAGNEAEWAALLPPTSPYQIVPLTTPAQLLEESSTMHHCVATYVEECLSGDVRIFSVRSTADNRHIATAELRFSAGSWNVVQLKGKHNKELIQHLAIAEDPMCILLQSVSTWYNRQHQSGTDS